MSLERAWSTILASRGRLFEELLHLPQGLRADVVFDAFGVGGGGFLADAEGQQKLVHDLVSAAGRFCETRALTRQLDGSIRFGRHQTVALQPSDRSIGRDVSHPEMGREVDQPAGSFGVDQIGDGFDVILGEFRSMIIADALVQFLASLSTVHCLHTPP